MAAMMASGRHLATDPTSCPGDSLIRAPEVDGLPVAAARLGVALAQAHKPAAGDAERAARKLIAGDGGLLAAVHTDGSLGDYGRQAVLATAGAWYRRLAGRRLVWVHGRLSLSRLAWNAAERTWALPDPPRRMGFPEQDLVALAVDAYLVAGVAGTGRRHAAALVRGACRRYGLSSPLYRFFVALALLRSPGEAARRLGLPVRRLGRSIAFALAGPATANELPDLLDVLLGPRDPWVQLDVPIRADAADRAGRVATGTPSPRAADVATASSLDGLVGSVTAVAGRVATVRRHARVDFVDLELRGRGVQVAFERAAGGPRAPRPAGGDWLLVRGTVRRTSSMTPTLFVDEVLAHQPCVLDRARWPLGSESLELVLAQGRVLKACRRYFEQAGFVEASSPVLTPSFYGGRSRPYVTRRWTTKSDQYLRVTSELALKSVLAAGVPRCYEIGPMFRNEGEDPRHLSGFLLLEAYAAFMSVERLCDLVIPLLQEVTSRGRSGVPVRRVGARQALLEARGIDVDNPDGLAAAARLADVPFPTRDAERAAVVYKLLESVVMPESDGILVLTGLPVGTTPLIAHDGGHYRRAWLALNGVFIADVAQEQVSYHAVRDALAEQLAADPYPVERDYRSFLAVLAGGVPPCAGIGLGMSPLFKAVLGLDDMRDTILGGWCAPADRAADRPGPSVIDPPATDPPARSLAGRRARRSRIDSDLQHEDRDNRDRDNRDRDNRDRDNRDRDNRDREDKDREDKDREDKDGR